MYYVTAWALGHLSINSVASSLFEVVSSLQSKQNAWLSEQQQGYLFQTNALIPHKTSQQAHTRLVNYTWSSLTLVDTQPLPEVHATFVTLE